MGPQEDFHCSSFLLFPFFSPVDKVIYFAKHSEQVMCRGTVKSPLLLGHLGWLFNQDWKAPTPAECNSLLVLPFPNQGETPHQPSKTQVVPEELFNASPLQAIPGNKDVTSKKFLFCCQAAGASKQFLTVCAFMQFDACARGVYTLMLVTGSVQ